MGKKQTKKSVKRTAIKKPYNTQLDILKGFAILLVVLGHSVQTFATKGQFDNYLLFRIIYSFHMPLFMFLSGAAAAYSIRPMNFDLLKRKFYMLVIPFLSWYVVGYYLTTAHSQQTIETYTHKLVASPDVGLWFLWALFLNFCCLALGKKMEKYFKLYSYLVVWLAIMAVPIGKYGIGSVKWYLPFFISGYLIFLYRKGLVIYRNIAITLSVISFPVLVASWHRLYLPSPLTHMQGYLVNHHLLTVSAGSFVTINTYEIFALIYQYAVPFAGIGFTFWLLQLKSSMYLYRLLAFLGLYTLDIYVAHVYFFKYAFGRSWVEITSGFVIAFVGSFLLGFIVLRRVPILSQIFLGGRSTPTVLRFRRQRTA